MKKIRSAAVFLVIFIFIANLCVVNVHAEDGQYIEINQYKIVTGQVSKDAWPIEFYVHLGRIYNPVTTYTGTQKVFLPTGYSLRIKYTDESIKSKLISFSGGKVLKFAVTVTYKINYEIYK